MNTLWPPLTLLENELFSPSDALIERWRNGKELPTDVLRALESDPEAHARRAALDAATSVADETVTDDAPIPPMPPDLRALIRQRVAARKALFSRLPTPGQIVRIDEVRGPNGSLNWDLPRPLAVLLAEPTETRQVWYGWLATAESDYAGYWDLLLGSEDEPCDPLARMVQLWNPVHVYLPSVSRVLAELTPDRLAAVRALAVDCATAPEPDPSLAKPGQTMRRQVASHWVRTGTPLGGAEDPRFRYQQLYYAYAAAVREPAKLAAQAESSVPSWWENLAAAFSRFFEPYQPIAHAMGEADNAEDREDRHYQRPGLKLALTITDDDLAGLRLERTDAQTWRVRVLDAVEIVETARLDQAQPVVELRLDPAESRILQISNADQSQTYRIPLFGAEDTHEH